MSLIGGSYLTNRGKISSFNFGDPISSITLAVPSVILMGQKIYAMKINYVKNIHDFGPLNKPRLYLHQEELPWQTRKSDYTRRISVHKICQVILLVAI